MLELVKSAWIKFAIGFVLICCGAKQVLPFVIEVLKWIFQAA